MEDFVPFEISKKLKEKEYPQHMSDYHYVLENEDDDFEAGEKYPKDIIYQHISTIAAPTISQVLKWLRDKNITCLPHIDPAKEKWFFYVVILPQPSDFPEYMSSIIYNTYEEAALAGIEYILNNLI
jgi:hypothetical protein